jgi:hypothetical protein
VLDLLAAITLDANVTAADLDELRSGQPWLVPRLTSSRPARASHDALRPDNNPGASDSRDLST